MRLPVSRSLLALALLLAVAIGVFASVDRAFANLTIHIEVDRGDNSTYRVGDPLQLCWHTSDPTTVDIFDEHPSPVQLRNHVSANNSGSCLNRTVTTPTGQECFRMDVYQGSVSYNPIRVCITVAAAQGGGGNVQVHISTDRGEGSTYQVGDPIQICYGVSQAIYVTLIDHPASGPSNILGAGHDDGTGGCVNGTISLPTGQECFQIQASNSAGSSVLAQAQTCIHVQQASSSLFVSISTNRGEGATYVAGDAITICYTVSQPTYVTVNDLSPSGATHQILAGHDDGSGGCQNGTITPPTGHECFQIQASSSQFSSVLAQAQTCINVQPASQIDRTPPILSLPANMTVPATSSAGAMVSFSASANDAVDGARPVSCSPASGSTFSIGMTTVNCSSSDTSGNTANGSFTITVQPATPLVDLNGVSIDFGKHQPDGKVVVSIWRKSASLFIDTGTLSCPDGSAPSGASIVLTDRVTHATLGVYPLLMGSDGHWTTTFRPPAKISDAGLGTPGFPPGIVAVYDITLTALCADGSHSTGLGEVDLEDPSGFVTDAVTHKPIAGATVVLQRFVNGDWSTVGPTETVDGSPIISPQTNPQTTDANGHYQWDVAEGSWRVVVSASGYETQTSRSVDIPPPVTDLNIALQPTGGGSGPGGPGTGGPTFHGKFQLTIPVIAKQ